MKQRIVLGFIGFIFLSLSVGLNLFWTGPKVSYSSQVSPTPSLAPGTIAKDIADIEMVYVPSGSFEMGINAADASTWCVANNAAEDCLANLLDQYKAHTVTLPSFWIDRYEVTVQNYQRCVDEEVCKPIFLSWMPTANDDPQKPIVGTTWYEALEFCTWRAARLPTEQEWEYAASGPLNYSLPWGGNIVGEVIPINRLEAVAVGSLERDVSWIGAYDMAYNVQEWVEDRFVPYLPESSSQELTSQADLYRVLRGGGWTQAYTDSLTFGRYGASPSTKSHGIGFRCVRFRNLVDG